MSTSARWVLTGALILGAFVVAGILSGPLAQLLNLWGLPVTGFCAAFAVVLVGYLAAPKRKLLTAACVLFIGAAVAWLLVGKSWYPESYGPDRAYLPTYIPLIATYIGGVGGLLLVAILGRKARAA